MSDRRSKLIRKAASLPKGSEHRRMILKRLAYGGKRKAEYWFEPKGVRNLSVREYEDANRGTSAPEGDLHLRGVLHIKPSGANWDVEVPVKGVFSLTGHPHSGDLYFSAKTDKPLLKLVDMALFDYKVQDEIMKMLGNLDFVYYDD